MSTTTTLIAAGACVTALGGLMWLRATRDQVWGNHWGEPDHTVLRQWPPGPHPGPNAHDPTHGWPRWPEPDDGIEGP